VDFTRQPIIESVITAKEGCKLVVRSSKGVGQEEYFVDSVEVVSFGGTFFYRSLEKPKTFLVPATDYEILEVREARMVLKNVGSNRSIKIGGGKAKEEKAEAADEPQQAEGKKDRRRGYRRRRTRGDRAEEGSDDKSDEKSKAAVGKPPVELTEPKTSEGKDGDDELTTNVLRSLLPPPPTLIREKIEEYKNDENFRDAFFESSEADEEKSSSTEEAIEVEQTPDIEEKPSDDFFMPHPVDEPQAEEVDTGNEEELTPKRSYVGEIGPVEEEVEAQNEPKN